MKTIVILSTEPWGKMLLSKMHYAIELAGAGNTVYFIDPPRATGSSERVYRSGEEKGVQLIRIKPIRSALFLRHKLLPLYNLFMRSYIKRIKKITGEPIDELWNFNPNSFIAIKQFAAKKNLLLLYDFYTGAHVFRAAAASDMLLAPSQLILDHYKNVIPVKFIQHGLGNHFAEKARERLQKNEWKVVQGKKIKVGYTGNLLRQAMNITVVEKIITDNPIIEFHFWGPHSLEENNVTDATMALTEEWKLFLRFLKDSPHVYLHGVKDQLSLAAAMQEMDMFLFVYSAGNDMNGASNSHKLLEYLSTGKVIIGTFVSTYKDMGLMEMSPEEEGLPTLFTQVVENIPIYNAATQQQKRIKYALSNTYLNQVKRIHDLLYS